MFLLPLAPDADDGADQKRYELAKRVGSRTFYRIGDCWVDAAFDKEEMKTTKVEAYSEAYFELIRKHPELGKCFALGERVVVVLDSEAYETVPPAEPELSPEENNRE